MVLTVPRIPEGEWASAAAKVTAAVTSQVCHDYLVCLLSISWLNTLLTRFFSLKTLAYICHLLFVSQVDSHAEKRLSCLTDLFNAIPDATVQYSVLLDTLSYAKKANLVGLLAPVVKVGQPELLFIVNLIIAVEGSSLKT